MSRHYSKAAKGKASETSYSDSPKLKTNTGANSKILALVEEIQVFQGNTLAKAKEDFEKTLMVFEEALGSVLLSKNGDENHGSSALLGSPISSEEASPLSGALQAVRNQGYDNYNFLEVMRNKLSGMIDRINL